MDKNKLIGFALLAAALVMMFTTSRQQPPPRQAPPSAAPTDGSTPDGSTAPPPTIENAPPGAVGPAVTLPGAVQNTNSLFAPLTPRRAEERYETLANEFIEVRFTPYGGAIAEVALKQYPLTKGGDESYVLNVERHAPSLALLGFPGADANTTFELVSRDAQQIVWRATVDGQLELTRTYRISHDPQQQDPYVVRHETTLRNVGTGTVSTPPKLNLNLGTAGPLHAHDPGQYLNVASYNGDDASFIGPGNLDGGGFWAFFGLADGSPVPVIERPGPTLWAAVKNQYFATVVTPDQPATGVSVRRVELPVLPENPRPRFGVTGNLQFDGRQLAPGATETLGFTIYAGPKEYKRLVALGHREDVVMEWGSFIGFFSKLLLYLMTWLQSVVTNWGVAIIGTTVIIRTLLWPITASGTRAAKRMAKIQAPLKAIQEKYKDDRRRQQEETLKLFKEHKVNPLGGCLPLVVQIPIFFGLFKMLSSASELRFAEFLWVTDLSAPDTIARIAGLPLNIMPLLMGATMVIQMKMTPAPTTDNASAKMMKFMPYFVTALCYTFSSGLAVYWTASNVFSIFQQWVTNRKKDEPIVVAPVKPGAAERAKPVRDAKVTTVRDRKKKR